uniref:Uncharacterized protein n=1 Tax=Cacopsylla melanoneura TaxID=428564 RepID=A0A8D9EQD2_9HEMI
MGAGGVHTSEPVHRVLGTSAGVDAEEENSGSHREGTVGHGSSYEVSAAVNWLPVACCCCCWKLLVLPTRLLFHPPPLVKEEALVSYPLLPLSTPVTSPV